MDSMPESIDKNFKIKLIFPPMLLYPDLLYRDFSICLPYGMGILTAFLRKNGYSVEQEDLFIKIYNLNKNLLPFSKKRINLELIRNMPIDKLERYLNYKIYDRKVDQLLKTILQLSSWKGFSIIGFSINNYSQFFISLLLAKKVKEEIKIPIVFGGSLLRVINDEMFKKFSFVDYFILGEGENPLLKLINYLEGKLKIQEVPSLLYWTNNKLQINEKKYFSIEEQIMPDFNNLPLSLYKDLDCDNRLILPYQISSGCNRRCSFCNFLFSYKTESKSIQKIMAELKKMSNLYGSNYFYFTDISLNNSYEFLTEFCNSLIESNNNFFWQSYVHLGNLDKKILEKMKRAGCYSLHFGIESGSNHLLKRMQKGITKEKVSEIIKIIHELEINSIANFFIGFPHEKDDDIAQTEKFLIENANYLNSFRFYSFGLCKDSRIFKKPQKFGITNLAPISNNFLDFSFDEINGLKWKYKFIKQKKDYEKVSKAIYKIFIKKRRFFAFMPVKLFRIIEKVMFINYPSQWSSFFLNKIKHM